MSEMKKPSQIDTDRRAVLIDLEVRGLINPYQAAELNSLRLEADAYLNSVYPIELEDLTRLEERVARPKEAAR